MRENLGDIALANALGDFVQQTLAGSEYALFMIAAEIERHRGYQKSDRWIAQTSQQKRTHSLLVVGEAAGIANMAWRPGTEADQREVLRAIFKKMAVHDATPKAKKLAHQFAGVFRRNKII
jgi:hypothetical protein